MTRRLVPSADLLGFVASIAEKLVPREIRANVVVPGIVETLELVAAYSGASLDVIAKCGLGGRALLSEENSAAVNKAY